MKLLKYIINKIKKNNQVLMNNNGTTWLEYRRQWLLENNTWTCKKQQRINLKLKTRKHEHQY